MLSKMTRIIIELSESCHSTNKNNRESSLNYQKNQRIVIILSEISENCYNTIRNIRESL